VQLDQFLIGFFLSREGRVGPGGVRFPPGLLGFQPQRLVALEVGVPQGGEFRRRRWLGRFRIFR
jgi:hypothetical protein